MLQTKLISSLAKIFPDEVQGSNFTKATALNNEPFSFQVVFRANTIAREGVPVYVRIDSDLDLSLITCYKVGYVPVLSGIPGERDDHYSRTMPGLYPDPLFQRVVNAPIELDEYRNNKRFEVGENQRLIATADCYQALWITVNEDYQVLPAGEHTISVTFYHSDNGEELATETFTLHVVGASLHEQDLQYTCWFHCDCLADIYNVEIFSDRFFEIMRSFVTEAGKTGMNMILLPAFTPPLDTPIGKERMTAQLVGVEVKDGKYSFDFSLMKRYIELCRECGIYNFEHSHLFTQWGAKHAPKVMATVDGEYKRIFGWETDSLSEEYGAFLGAYLDALMVFFEEMNIGRENVLFHVSDEPITEHLEYYGNAQKVIKSHVKDYHCGDALTHYKYYEEGYVETPIPVHASPDIDLFIENCDNFWVYYTCGERGYGLSKRLISNTSARTRMIGIQMYVAGAKGFLHWAYNFYYNAMSRGLVNPFVDPGNGSCFMVYPGNDGTAVPSLREKVMNEGFLDYRALQTLEGYMGREAVLAFLKENFGKIDFHTCYDDYKLLKVRSIINAKIAEYVK